MRWKRTTPFPNFTAVAAAIPNFIAPPIRDRSVRVGLTRTGIRCYLRSDADVPGWKFGWTDQAGVMGKGRAPIWVLDIVPDFEEIHEGLRLWRVPDAIESGHRFGYMLDANGVWVHVAPTAAEAYLESQGIARPHDYLKSIRATYEAA
ncbi:hypothetical protein [Lacipirellula parvula]|uniref:Uncharacterized protein n=1 Tax=Lacipirellula parvula TaxID=2650471 RepID=A0A5K7XGZ4_9BACT|nr:hypothetical protein [Lacipirellula parvula]BBO34211.1 hypothetical protein PLANPX_3823 [Lacipirellula parvula]